MYLLTTLVTCLVYQFHLAASKVLLCGHSHFNLTFLQSVKNYLVVAFCAQLQYLHPSAGTFDFFPTFVGQFNHPEHCNNNIKLYLMTP